MGQFITFPEIDKILSSPNCDDRPENTVVDTIIIHGISLPPQKFGGDFIENFFMNRLEITGDPFFREIADLRVSSHLLIKRDGETIQFVPFEKRAWHAGESKFDGRTRCNDFSIGIELEGTDTLPYEKCQYEKLVKIINRLKTCFAEITNARIIGHCDVAPGRKTDPGPHFDWDYLKSLLRM